MKMKRGELVGFQGCLGYDYDVATKSLSINEAGAKTVRYFAPIDIRLQTLLVWSLLDPGINIPFHLIKKLLTYLKISLFML